MSLQQLMSDASRMRSQLNEIGSLTAHGHLVLLILARRTKERLHVFSDVQEGLCVKKQM